MNNSRNVDLPTELVSEILLRLPVKAILQCKCVCKEWCALIGSRSFIDCHFSHESNQDYLLFQLMSSPVGRFEFAVNPYDGRHLRIDASDFLSAMPIDVCSLLGPAHGIFCVVSRSNRVSLPMRVDLFNPATRKFKLLPPIPLLKPRGLEFGFGFDPFSGDYKVVAFREKFFCVYHSSNDSWREIEVVDSLNERIHEESCSDHGVFLNGLYHWLLDGMGCRSILAFDMRSENFQEMIVPEAIRYAETLVMVDIIAYGDSIALLSLEEEVGQCVSLWVMGGGDGLWVKCFSIDLPQLKIYSLCLWNKNELLLQSLERVTETENEKASVMLKCDISTQKLLKLGPEFDHLIVSGVFSYKESLFSIEGETDTVITRIEEYSDEEDEED